MSKKIFTSFRWPIIFASLVEITSNFLRMYCNRSRFYIQWKRTVHAYLCHRDGSVVLEINAVIWKSTVVTRTVPVWSLFIGICEGTGLCPSFFLLALTNSSSESPLHCLMLPETCNCLFGKSLTTNLTCAVSQAVHILNTYEIGPRIYL